MLDIQRKATKSMGSQVMRNPTDDGKLHMMHLLGEEPHADQTIALGKQTPSIPTISLSRERWRLPLAESHNQFSIPP